jgi:hypothetical protein
LRLVRDEEWLVRREPVDERLTGDDPVPVVMAEEKEDVARVAAVAVAVLVTAAFGSAWPHRLQ